MLMVSEPIQLTVGSNLNVLDIYLNVDGVAINASGVTFSIKDAANVEAATGTAINTAVGTYTASGTVPAGFALGTWRIDWTITPVGGTAVTASEEFGVQAIAISFSNRPATDVVEGVYDAVRADIGDPDAKVFNDAFLRRILIKAVRRLNNKLSLAPTMRGPTGVEGNFGGRRIRVIPITIDLDTGVINPPGDEYEDLLILQMEYIIVSSEISALKRLSASGASGPFVTSIGDVQNDGIKVRNADGVEITISGGRLRERASLMKFDANQKKEELQEAVRRFLGRLTGNFGKMIW
jgi:hypothetical protein